MHKKNGIRNHNGAKECLPELCIFCGSVHGSVCVSYFHWGSAGLCWHAAARYFQGKQLRKCPWHVRCTVQHTLPRLARPAVTNNHRLQSPLHPSRLLHTDTHTTLQYPLTCGKNHDGKLSRALLHSCFARCILSSPPSLQPS